MTHTETLLVYPVQLLILQWHLEAMELLAACAPTVATEAVKLIQVLANGGVEAYYDRRIEARQLAHEEGMQLYQPFQRYLENGSTPAQDLSQLAFVRTGFSLAVEPDSADERRRIETKLSREGLADVPAQKLLALQQPAVYVANKAEIVLLVTCAQVPEYHQRLYKGSKIAMPNVFPAVFTLKLCGYDLSDNLQVCHVEVTRLSAPVNLVVALTDNMLTVL